MILILSLFPVLLHYSVHLGILWNTRRISSEAHKEMAIMVLVVSAIFGIWLQSLTGISWYKYFTFFLSTHFLLFDYLFNLTVLHKPWYYLGGNFWDKEEAKINHKVLLVIRIILYLLSLIFLKR